MDEGIQKNGGKLRSEKGKKTNYPFVIDLQSENCGYSIGKIIYVEY